MSTKKRRNPSSPFEPKDIMILGEPHRLSVQRFTAGSQEMELLYRVTPPLPWGDEDETVLFAAEATDDVGTVYYNQGGFFGPSEDGRAMEGSITIRPAPPEKATRITLELTVGGPGEWSVIDDLTFPLDGSA